MDVNKELQLYKKTVRFFSESANDYLYVLDLVNRRIHIADKICGKYPLPLPGEEGICRVLGKALYTTETGQLQKEIEEIAEGRKDRHAMNYRLTDRDGHRVWINAESEVQKDDGESGFFGGSNSELAVGQKTDSLTGLWNYDKFLEDMTECRDRAAATS